MICSTDSQWARSSSPGSGHDRVSSCCCPVGTKMWLISLSWLCLLRCLRGRARDGKIVRARSLPRSGFRTCEGRRISCRFSPFWERRWKRRWTFSFSCLSEQTAHVTADSAWGVRLVRRDVFLDLDAMTHQQCLPRVMDETILVG